MFGFACTVILKYIILFPLLFLFPETSEEEEAKKNSAQRVLLIHAVLSEPTFLICRLVLTLVSECAQETIGS